MEYIKKEDLIEGEIYNSTLYNHIFKYMDKLGDRNINCANNHFGKYTATVGIGLDNIINATNEEKHWLETCIKLDKFIEYDEAMETFIPEYVECIKGFSDYIIENYIYKVINSSDTTSLHLNCNIKSHYGAGCNLYVNIDHFTFKPSTKEAYDAQFVVKKEGFVLPEKWFIKTTDETFDIIKNWANKMQNPKEYDNYIHHDKVTFNNDGGYRQSKDRAEITFDQFKKYVLEEKVVEPEFVLPEKWCILRDCNNYKTINKWFTDNGYGFPSATNTIIAISKSRQSYISPINNEIETHVKITFEQFKKYVLKEEVIEEKVIEEPIIENKSKLEIWLENTKALKLSLDDLITYIEHPNTCKFDEIFKKLDGAKSKDKAEILFDKWSKEIIEPLPQFKVIETIETITKVENNEGNQFFVGDFVTVDGSNFIEIIQSFEYQLNKTVLCAVFINNSFIDINKIEHYIEPKVIEPEFILPEKWCVLRDENNFTTINNWCNKNKLLGEQCRYLINKKRLVYSEKPNTPWNAHKRFSFLKDDTFTEITFDQFKKYVLKEEVKEETLLEKAKRLYPVGTKYKCAYSGRQFIVTLENFSQTNLDTIYGELVKGCLLYEGKWAEIIE